ncbi:hypothetical protein [Photobacterium leiognathi]|uniref:hypothetical protein n=1 Tax=Photobacterium leiognathi TaxID=553611 RepID=UPI0029816299|nr:hypothetical protein [Photobacterium leiognathi]
MVEGEGLIDRGVLFKDHGLYITNKGHVPVGNVENFEVETHSMFDKKVKPKDLEWALMYVLMDEKLNKNLVLDSYSFYFHETDISSYEKILDNGFKVGGERSIGDLYPLGVFHKSHAEPIGVSRDSFQMLVAVKDGLPVRKFQNREDFARYCRDELGLGEFIEAMDKVDEKYQRIVDAAIERKHQFSWRGITDEKKRYEMKALWQIEVEKVKKIFPRWTQESELASKKYHIALEQKINLTGQKFVIEHDEGSFGRETKTYIVCPKNIFPVSQLSHSMLRLEVLKNNSSENIMSLLPKKLITGSKCE